jgi:hypothetical protein
MDYLLSLGWQDYALCAIAFILGVAVGRLSKTEFYHVWVKRNGKKNHKK